jgi:hypothetical protein
VTEWRNTDEADAAGGAPPAARARRRLLTRALPSGVAFFAALTVPEISVGAGDLAPGERLDEPVKPVPRAGQAAVKPGLAGVRYAPLLRLPETAPAPLVAPITAAEMTPGRTETSIAPEFAPAPASLPVEVAADAAPAADAPAFVAVTPDADNVLLLSAHEIVPDDAPLPVEDTAPPLAALVSPQPEAPSLPSGVGSEREAFFAAPAAIDPPVAGLGEGFVAEEQTALTASAPVREERAALAVAPVLAAPVPVVPAGRIETPPAALAPLPPPVARPAPRPAAAPLASAPPVQAARPATPVAAVAAIPATKPPLTAAKPGNNTVSTDAMFGIDIKSQLVTRVDGKTAGAVDFRQTATGLSVRLGSIVDVLADRYDAAQVARIRASSAANAYIPLAELQAQGIPISYDPVYDEFNVGHTDTRPKAGRKVHIDQITAPERGLGSTGMDQVRR